MLGEPGPDTKRVGFVCHGYRQLAGRFLEYFKTLDGGASVVVAPEGLSRFYNQQGDGEHGADAKIGASWMTREDRENEIHDYVNYLDVLYARVLGDFAVADCDIFALGFSQGVATACRWLMHGVAPINHLVVWGGVLPPDLDVNKFSDVLKKVRVTFVIGESDEFVPVAAVEADHKKLSDAGVETELVKFDGGHRISKQALSEVFREET